MKTSVRGKPNKGDVAEAILGAAMTASFRRGFDHRIQQDEVEDILSDIADRASGCISPVMMEYQAERTSGETDTILLRVCLPKPSMRMVIDRSVITDKSMAPLFKSSVGFVNNSGRLAELAEMCADGITNTIRVFSGGTENQRGTKVDIKTEIDGDSEVLKISLKVTGGAQIGQSVGLKFENITRFWKSMGIFMPGEVQQEFDKIVETSIAASEAFESRDKLYVTALKELGPLFQRLYESALKQAKSLVGNDQKDINFIKNVVGLLREQATRGEPGVVLVKLSTRKNGGFSTLSFDQSLSDEIAKLDFDVKIEFEDSLPKMIFFDRKTEKDLFQIRTRLDTRKVKAGRRLILRTYVETKPFLFELTSD